ncbi:MAG TPA: serine/threonine-protein kinase [Myxococcota bacterium]|nr:serine/threonine-protein kinase [Myxococcota bacterium]
MEKHFGKYVLTERLGGGGMAEVFRARLHGPGGFEKDLAVKLILPQFSDEPEFVEMFIREATLAARLDHAAIVRIHEFDQIDGTYYIAMELVDGKDLRTIMARARKRNRPAHVAEVLMVALDVCRGLAFAHGELTQHSTPIIHRDISPHNIIISRAGEVKITDFGIAKIASAASITRTGVIKGKASYMSPEQARGGAVDPRSDLFSLGCVIWEMLTGQRLFSGENDLVVLEKLQHGKIDPPGRYNTEVPGEVDKLVLKLLSRDSAGRYSSAGELSSELEQLLVAAGVERGSILSEMYRELFESERAGTGLLPAAVAETADAAESREGAGEPATDPAAARAEGDAVQPVGPHVPTLVAAEENGSPATAMISPGWPPSAWRGLMRRPPALWVAAVLSMVFIAVFVSTLDWGSSPDPVDAGVPAASASAPAAPVHLFLRPGLETGDGEARSPGDKPLEKPDSVEPEKSPAAVAHGTLYLNVIPWAKVYWRKRLLGDTPLEHKRLPVGEQRLLLVNKDLHVKKIIKVMIHENSVTRRVVNLKAQK